MSEQFLGSLDIRSSLSQERRQSMAKRVPTDLLIDVQTFSHGPDVPSQDHLWLQRLRPVLQE